MSNNNYLSDPSTGTDIYGDWRPKGFLAGMNYGDAKRDYETVRNLKNESTAMENLKSILANRKELKKQPVYEAENYRDKLKAITEGNELGIQREVQDQTRPDEIEHRLWKASVEKRGERAGEHFRKLAQISDLLQYPGVNEKDPVTQLRILESTLPPGEYNEIVEGMKKMQPDQLRQVLKAYSTLNPERLKYYSESTLQGEKYDREDSMLDKRLASAEKIAAMESKARVAASKASGGNTNATEYLMQLAPEWEKAKINEYEKKFRKDRGRNPNEKEKGQIQFQVTMDWVEVVGGETALTKNMGQVMATMTMMDRMSGREQPSETEQFVEPEYSTTSEGNDSSKGLSRLKDGGWAFDGEALLPGMNYEIEGLGTMTYNGGEPTDPDNWQPAGSEMP